MSKKLKDEEIRSRIIAIFRESGSFFQMKEIETAGKGKGIPQKDFKPNLQSLVDEDLIKTNKIGNSSYYWIESPQKAIDAKIKKLDELKERNKELNSRIEILKTQAERIENEVMNNLTLNLLLMLFFMIIFRMRKMNLTNVSVFT